MRPNIHYTTTSDGALVSLSFDALSFRRQRTKEGHMPAAPTLETDLEPGLSIDEIEIKLCTAAERHHLEERNIAYWLHEIDVRGLHRERGFSSLGDYAMELVGIKPRKAQYLAFLAGRLETLPHIRAAFDSGSLSWTKAREIVSVATAETEAAWLEKGLRLSNRELERETRRHAGGDSGKFATVTLSMPVEVLEMWHDAFELAERVSGTALEKWQVLELALAEFLSTHLPADGHAVVETADETNVLPAARNAVLERDGWQCQFAGCTMRTGLEVHHIVFRARGGSDDAKNLITMCHIHHGLVHRGICNITGRVGKDLEFERPRLVTEPTPTRDDGGESDQEVTPNDDDTWRDDTVSEIFDGPPTPGPIDTPYGSADPWAMWVNAQRRMKLEDRNRARRRPPGAHVCAGAEE